jgi:hypothetical protein
MKEKILTGWTWRRFLFAGIGIALIIQDAMYRQWPGIVMGSYFLLMGIAGMGCAGGACTIPAAPDQEKKQATCKR